jgi:inorganic pyrophosphatase
MIGGMASIAARPRFCAHPWHGVPIGPGAPEECTAVIEIPEGSNVKYEMDKETGLLRVDRVLYSAVFYPANYGFLPRTLGADGDALDVLVLSQASVAPLSLMSARTLGAISLWDQGIADDKILAVATGDPEYASYRSLRDLPEHRITMLKRFFEDYKKLEGKEIRVGAMQPARAAYAMIREAMRRYRRGR